MDFGIFQIIFELVLHFNDGVVFQIHNLDPLIITIQHYNFSFVEECKSLAGVLVYFFPKGLSFRVNMDKMVAVLQDGKCVIESWAYFVQYTCFLFESDGGFFDVFQKWHMPLLNKIFINCTYIQSEYL